MTITKIPATVGMHSTRSPARQSGRRVAAYARVSTDSEEQLNSYNAQVDYYTQYIQSRADWLFVEVYSDEGISATSTRQRGGFNRMIKDALDGKIDLIVTKSISRFARNTVDSLVTVRQLKEKGTEVYFEKENIYTLDSKGELLITILSSLAQEESRNLSENVKWGKRKQFSEGKFTVAYKRFLGYEKGEDGQPGIVESEARIVRLIYNMFLTGKNFTAIANHLMDMGIPAPGGLQRWHNATVLSILRNEKYKGDALLQKRFTVDFLTKKMKKNEGEVPQYYVTGSHPAIIEPETHALVQAELDRRKSPGGVSCFSGKVICGECGGVFGPKLWHSTSKYRRTVWQCNKKYAKDKKCPAPHLYDAKLKAVFIEAFNRLVTDKAQIISEYNEEINSIIDNSSLESDIETPAAELDVIRNRIRRHIEDSANATLSREEYDERRNAMLEEHNAIVNKINEIEVNKRERAAKHERIARFLTEVEHSAGFLTEFDEELWRGVVESMTVYGDNDFAVMFKDGSEVRISGEES
jgi:DNA invertase Pin-like site-specific DNA recombinase